MSSEKCRKFCTKILVSQSLYNQVPGPRLGLQTDYKETPTQEFSCDICEIIKNTLFTEHPQWLHLQLTYKLRIYFTKVTGKHLWRRLFCKCYKPLACILIKKETSTQIFFWEICECFKKSMLIEHIQATSSGNKRSWK